MKYLAMYDVRALEFDTGNNIPYKATEYWRFDALDDKAASIEADKHGEIIRNRLVDGKVDLEQLLRIEEIIFEKKGGKR